MEKVNYKIRPLYSLGEDRLLIITSIYASDIMDQPIKEMKAAIEESLFLRYGSKDFKLENYWGDERYVVCNISIKKTDSVLFLGKSPFWCN